MILYIYIGIMLDNAKKLLHYNNRVLGSRSQASVSSDG